MIRKPVRGKLLLRHGLFLLIAILLVGCLEYLGFLRGVDLHFHDLALRMRGVREASKEVVIVAIDEKSLLRLGRWPIRRHHYATLLQMLGEARAVGLDILFPEPFDDDVELSEAIQRHGRVVLPAYIDHRFRISYPNPAFSSFPSGHIHLDQGVDGVVRKVFHRMEYDGKVLHSLSSVVYRLAQFSGSVVTEDLRLKESPSGRQTISQRDPMMINYYGARGSFPHISLIDMMDGKWPSSFFRGKIVLVGVTSPGIEESILTPLGQDRNRMPGVEVHAHILNNLMDGTQIKVLDPLVRWLWVLGVSILAFWLFLRFGGWRAALLWFLGILGVLAASQASLSLFYLWVPPAAFLFTFSLSYVAAYILNLERMKRLLLRAEKDWEESFNTIQDAITIHDREGNVVKANRAARQFFGPPLLDLLSKRCLDCQTAHTLSRDGGKAGGAPLMAAEVTEETFAAELGRYLEIKSMPRLDQNGQFEGMVQIVRDITQRVESEEAKRTLQSQLIQAQKMEAIGTLAGGIAHDFNNMLAAILGYTELALFDIPEGSPAKKKLQEVLNGGDRARKLVQRILTFSRQGEQTVSPVPVGSIVKEALKLLRSTLPATIEIKTDIRSEGRVMGDPTQIHQILMNLCTNSYHAMLESGGTLRISLDDESIGPEAESGGLTPGPYMRMRVSDTGHGMTPEVMERIFEPYFTTKEKGAGTGLGLAVVHGIIQNHRGRITVESEPEKGTTFDILLPRIEEARGQGEQDPGPLAGGHERILLVDDETILLDMGRQMLEQLGYRVNTEASSLRALRMFQEDPNRFDLIITDMTMPNMTGEKLAREILQIRRDIPVVLCTGYSEGMSAEKAASLGIRTYLMKPLNMRDLSRTIRRALGRP
jgi:PAS domain S-box-containing protein